MIASTRANNQETSSFRAFFRPWRHYTFPNGEAENIAIKENSVGLLILINIAQFTVHALIGILIFMIIASTAIGLDLLIGMLEKYDVSVYVTKSLTVIEYVIFLCDIALFTTFLTRSSFNFMRRHMRIGK